MDVNAKNTQTGFILFTQVQMQDENKNTFRKDICQPLGGGFLWGKKDGDRTGQGNKGTTTSSVMFYFLKEKSDRKKFFLKRIFSTKETIEGKGKTQGARFGMSGARTRQWVTEELAVLCFSSAAGVSEGRNAHHHSPSAAESQAPTLRRPSLGSHRQACKL